MPDGGLKVIIVGAGLAGLTTARILREHHSVTVYERGTLDVATGGQGLHFAAAAVKILNSIGYDPERAQVVTTSSFRVVEKDGSISMETKLPEESWTGLRADMRAELVRLATASSEELGISGEPARIVTECAVVDVDVENGRVVFQDGRVDTADLVIVADGVHSRLRKCILGKQNHSPKKVGLTIYRVAIPTEAAKRALNNQLPAWALPDAEGKGASALFTPCDGSNRMAVAYPCKDFAYINLSCVVTSSAETMEAGGSGSWFDDADRGEILKSFDDFPDIVKLMTCVDPEAKVWDMQDLDNLPFWNRGRAIVIGDAAHAMTPMMGIGANLAIEDAEAFRLMVGVKAEDVPAVLGAIDGMRRPRAKKVLELNRQTTPETSLQERLEKMALVLKYEGVGEKKRS